MLAGRGLGATDPDVISIGLPQVHAGRASGANHLGSPAGHPGEHRIEERLGYHLDAAAPQPSGQHRSHPVRPPRDVPQPVRSVVYRVHRGHHGQQHLRGADIAGGLLPANVLLTGLQRQAQRRRGVGVAGHADQPARQLAFQPTAHSQVGGVWPAEAQRHAEALRRSDRDVGADLPRRCQQGQRQRVGRDGHRGTALVRLLDQHRMVPHRTGDAWVGQQHTEELAVRESGP